MDELISPSELDEFFKLIGRGLWYLQNVEDVLSSYLTLKAKFRTPAVVSNKEIKRTLKKYRSKTLGDAIEYAREKNLFEEDLLSQLDAFNKERNWLIHRSIRKNRDDLYNRKKREATFKRIENFGQQAINLHSLIAHELEAFVISCGVSKVDIENETQRIAKEKGLID